MSGMMRLLRDEAGATAIEYGLLAALIAVAAIGAMQGFGNEFSNTFNTATRSMAQGNSGA
ncbi:MAG: Flp family type IVb pilin [Novosphingobium sp.]|jgi:pilus assembly protein Flp/PilA|uniref:Flp family type IVb pilin n=1 Tax=Novosphingobium sp. TaxID=1874826 RepID=UPI00391999B3